MQTPEGNNAPNTLQALFCRALEQPFSDACKAQWVFSLPDQPASTLPALHEAAVYRFTFSAPLAGEALLFISHATVNDLGLRETELNQAGLTEERAAVLLSTCQAAAGKATELLAEHGSIFIEVEQVTTPELPDEQWAEVWLQSADKKRLSFQLLYNHALLTAFRAASAEMLSYPAAAQKASSNLDLVLDVELSVTLRFGQRQLALREILDLTSGSVVELDRQVDEPVELVLDGKVVARGEAVIIDGNYGMRITQVLQPIVASA